MGSASPSRSATCRRSPPPATRACCSSTVSQSPTRWPGFRCPPTTAAIWPPAPRASDASSTSATAGWRPKSAPRSRPREWCSSGIDVIGGFVTEINVTSPTGIREIDQQFGLNIGAMVIEAFERRIGRRREMSRALQLREGIAPTRDRLTTTVFMAALVHGVIIVGVTFGSTSQHARRRAGPRGADRVRRRARGTPQRHRHLPGAAYPARLGRNARPGRGEEPARRGGTGRQPGAAPTAPA